MLSARKELELGQVFVGHDWAEEHHDVELMDVAGRRLAKARLPEGAKGVSQFHELVARHTGEASEVVVATETERGLFLGALIAAGYKVHAVNPMSVARYRERHSTSGAKSDPGDAHVLADLARTDSHNHRQVAGDSELAEAIKVLARAHQGMIWSRQRQLNQLRSALREFYPAALAAFDDLGHPDALAVLAIAPTPELGRGLSRSKIAAALRRGGRQRRVDESAVEVQAALRSEQLAAPALISRAMGASAKAYIAVIAELGTQVAALETELSAHFEVQSSGTTPDATPMASLAGTTPPRHRSPRPQASPKWCWPALHATAAWPTPATDGLFVRSRRAPAPKPFTTNAGPRATPTTAP